MACFAIARTDLQLLVDDATKIIEDEGLRRVVANWLKRELGLATPASIVANGTNNVTFYAGSVTMFVSKYGATTFIGDQGVALKPKFETYIKQLLTAQKALDLVESLKSKGVVLEDTRNEAGNYVVTIQYAQLSLAR